MQDLLPENIAEGVNYLFSLHVQKKKALKYNNRIHNYCFPEKQLPTQGEHKINAGTSRGVSGCYYQVIKATAVIDASLSSPAKITIIKVLTVPAGSAAHQLTLFNCSE